MDTQIYFVIFEDDPFTLHPFMNFLAHIFLSGDDPQIKIGNFMADGIRGQDYLGYPPGIKKGILLHRAIDTFTDEHPIFRRTTKRLHAEFHHYSGVIADVFYDHFLAKNWERYHPDKLEVYAQSFYHLLEENFDILTPKVQNLLPIMIRYNWLVSYASVEGIGAILTQMDSRTQYKSGMKKAGASLVAHYDAFETDFTEFFAQLQVMCLQKLNERDA